MQASGEPLPRRGTVEIPPRLDEAVPRCLLHITVVVEQAQQNAAHSMLVPEIVWTWIGGDVLRIEVGMAPLGSLMGHLVHGLVLGIAYDA